MKIRTGDTVAIIAGRDRFVIDKKGNKTRRTGRVLKVLRDQNKVVVEGVNLVTKHQSTQYGEEGGRYQIEAPIHVSNVALINPQTNTPTRVGTKIDEKGNKVRVSTKKTGSVVLDK